MPRQSRIVSPIDVSSTDNNSDAGDVESLHLSDDYDYVEDVDFASAPAQKNRSHPSASTSTQKNRSHPSASTSTQKNRSRPSVSAPVQNNRSRPPVSARSRPAVSASVQNYRSHQSAQDRQFTSSPIQGYTLEESEANELVELRARCAELEAENANLQGRLEAMSYVSSSVSYHTDAAYTMLVIRTRSLLAILVTTSRKPGMTFGR
jgi:hypothetical protein